MVRFAWEWIEIYYIVPALYLQVTSGCSFYLFCVWFAGLVALYTYDRREDGAGMVISDGGGTLLQQYSVYIDRAVGGVHRINIPASERAHPAVIFYNIII